MLSFTNLAQCEPQSAADAGEGKLQAKRQAPPVRPAKPSKNTIDGLFKKAVAPPQKHAEVAAPARSRNVFSGSNAANKKTAFGDNLAAEKQDPATDRSPKETLPAEPSKAATARLDERPGAQDQSSDAERDGSREGAGQLQDSHQNAAKVQKAADFSSREDTIEQPNARDGPSTNVQKGVTSDSSDGTPKEDSGRETTANAQEKQAEPLNSNKCTAAEGSAQENASSQGREPSHGRRRSPGQDQGADEVGGGNAEEETPRKEESEGLDPTLQGIDMREQKRIMHEIWMRNNLRQSERSPKKQARKQSNNASSNVVKQPRLTDRFFKRA